MAVFGSAVTIKGRQSPSTEAPQGGKEKNNFAVKLHFWLDTIE